MGKVPLVIVAAVAFGSMASCRTPREYAAAPALKSLLVKTTIGWGGTLKPEFSEGIDTYSLKLGGDCTGIEVTAESGATDQTVSIDGEDVVSGTPTLVAPPVGASKISITVRDASGKRATYAVSVDRENIRPVAEKFLRLRYDDPESGISMVYRLFIPAGYESEKRYPLVLYLHGAGELKTDDDALLTGSQGPTIWAKPEEQAKRPCFVLAPHCRQSPDGDLSGALSYGTWGWTSLMRNGPVPRNGLTPFEPLPMLSVAYKILEKVVDEYGIDRKRIYTTGLSMGAYGVWALNLAHPETFAALVPIAGGGDPERLSLIAKKPIWVFHGAEDGIVPVSASRASVAALKAAGGKPKYTEYPVGTFFFPNAHFSWVPAYADEEMREWLFRQSL